MIRSYDDLTLSTQYALDKANISKEFVYRDIQQLSIMRCKVIAKDLSY